MNGYPCSLCASVCNLLKNHGIYPHRPSILRSPVFRIPGDHHPYPLVFIGKTIVAGSEHSGKGALKAVSENHKETEREASPGKVRKRGRIIQFAPFLCARCSCYCGTINRSSVRINVAWAGTRMSNSLSSKPINACTSATCRRSLSSPTR